MAKQMCRALTNMAYNPNHYPELEGQLWAKAGEVAEIPERLAERADLVQLLVNLGKIELVEPPKVYTPSKAAKGESE